MGACALGDAGAPKKRNGLSLHFAFGSFLFVTIPRWKELALNGCANFPKDTGGSGAFLFVCAVKHSFFVCDKIALG